MWVISSYKYMYVIKLNLNTNLRKLWWWYEAEETMMMIWSKGDDDELEIQETIDTTDNVVVIDILSKVVVGMSIAINITVYHQ